MNKAKPFLKWAGGKRSLLPQLHKLLPKPLLEGEVKYYREPFLGGGAMFFYLYNKGLLPGNVFLNDVNLWLMNVWKVIESKSKLKALMFDLERKQSIYWNNTPSENKGYYQSVRNEYNYFCQGVEAVSISQAARFIFLNKTCFNGLYRVNNDGDFNVPMGNYRKPKILDRDNLLSVHKCLSEDCTLISAVSYDTINLENGFIYLDPPYRKFNEQGFVSYTSEKFSDDDLFKLCQKLKQSKGYWMLSNADIGDGFLESLLTPSEYRWHYLTAKRSISCKGDDRKPAKEVVITNY